MNVVRVKRLYINLDNVAYTELNNDSTLRVVFIGARDGKPNELMLSPNDAVDVLAALHAHTNEKAK